jgi:hypothetical protein
MEAGMEADMARIAMEKAAILRVPRIMRWQLIL